VAAVPELSREDTVFMSGVELYQYTFKQFLAFAKLVGELGFDSAGDIVAMKKEFGLSLFPTDVHFSMFANAMQNQASDEQRDTWMQQVSFPFPKNKQTNKLPTSNKQATTSDTTIPLGLLLGSDWEHHWNLRAD